MLEGLEVQVIDMMLRREERAEEQNAYIYRYHYPVISFCLNIPGPVKTTEKILKLFNEGLMSVHNALEEDDINILDELVVHEKTGDEAIICVEAKAGKIKDMMTGIEESHPLGRLFDIDVIDIDGDKLSRPSFRKCLICDRQAQDCARARTHSVGDMQRKISEMLDGYFR